MPRRGPTKPNKSGVALPTDVVMTPTHVAQWIMDYFQPTGSMLEPCRGTGNIYNLMGKDKDWCEITEGKDFLTYEGKVDWVITNPPYSIFDVFLQKCFEIADDIVLLVPLTKVFRGIKVDRKIQEFGGIKEIVYMGGGGTLGFSFGFPCGCIHYQRGYKGPIKLTRTYDEKIPSHLRRPAMEIR